MRGSRARGSLRPTPLAVSLALGCSVAASWADEQANAATQPDQHSYKHGHSHAHAAHAAKAAPVQAKPAPATATTPTAQQTAATLSNAKGHGPQIVAQQDGSNAEEWTVVASPMNTLRTPIGLSRMPQDVLHTPQTIDVVPQILMQQQNVKSLDEALKNVPGITASVGEGEGGMSGDQF